MNPVSANLHVFIRTSWLLSCQKALVITREHFGEGFRPRQPNVDHRWLVTAGGCMKRQALQNFDAAESDRFSDSDKNFRSHKKNGAPVQGPHFYPINFNRIFGFMGFVPSQPRHQPVPGPNQRHPIHQNPIQLRRSRD